MAIRDIVLIGAPVLKTPTEPVEKIDKNIKNILDDMKETMYHAEGVGLAAPQVGLSLRMCVIDDGTGYNEYINPEIIKTSEETEDLSEGCLSIPDFVGIVERFTEVTVEYTDRKGNRKRKKASGLLAQAIQHEVDHLDGILFIERAKALYRKEQEEEATE